MNSYVLGFLFSKDLEKVWLISKNKPVWQKGRLNGIGGKIELNESPIDAMVREFKEEAGLEIKDWKWFCTLTDDSLSYEVYCYHSFSDDTAKTMTDENVCLYEVNNIPENTLENLSWLIPMALSFLTNKKVYGLKIIYTP